MQTERNEKSEQVKELNRSKAEIENFKRENGELKEAIEAAAQKKVERNTFNRKRKIRKSEENRNELKFNELQKQLEDQTTYRRNEAKSGARIYANAMRSARVGDRRMVGYSVSTIYY